MSTLVGHTTQATGTARVQPGQITGVMAGALRRTQIDVKIGVKLATTVLVVMEKVQLGTTWEKVGVGSGDGSPQPSARI